MKFDREMSTFKTENSILSIMNFAIKMVFLLTHRDLFQIEYCGHDTEAKKKQLVSSPGVRLFLDM